MNATMTNTHHAYELGLRTRGYACAEVALRAAQAANWPIHTERDRAQFKLGWADGRAYL